MVGGYKRGDTIDLRPRDDSWYNILLCHALSDQALIDSRHNLPQINIAKYIGNDWKLTLAFDNNKHTFWVSHTRYVIDYDPSNYHFGLHSHLG